MSPKKPFLILAIFILSLRGMLAVTTDHAIIYPEDTYGRTLEYLILDLKLNASLVGGTTKANLFFQEYDMNGVRISIYGNEGHEYHPSAGTVLYDATTKSGYYKLVKSVQRSQTARGDEDFVVFASKKLKGTGTFPDWVRDGDGNEILTDEYITLLYDYVNFMFQQGIEIDVMGVDNEERFNKADITASQYKDIVDGLTTKLTTYGYKIPTWMGYEDYDPDLRDWVDNLMDNGWQDRMDIYGVHYYPSTRKLDELKTDLSKIGDIPFWSTEAHWSSKSDQDEIATAEIGMATLWDQTDQGLDGLCMWDFGGNSANQRFNIVKEALVPLKGAQPIFMDDLDGTSIADTQYGQQVFTRSFIEGSQVTVYVTNTTATDYDRYQFMLNYGTILGDVSYIQFRDDTPVTGEVGSALVNSENTICALDIPSRSITKLSFLMDPMEIIKLECEDLTYSSPTATTIEQQSNAMAAGGYHLNLSALEKDKSIEFTVDMPEDGVYKMMLVGLTWTTFGQYALQVEDASGNWNTEAGSIDLYGTSSSRNSYLWQNINLKSGENKIRFIVTGNNATSTSFKGSFDYLVFEKMNSSAIEDVINSEELCVYPSVVNTTLKVKGYSPLLGYHIYDLSGKRLMSNTTESLDVSELLSGLYILESAGVTTKFIKR